MKKLCLLEQCAVFLRRTVAEDVDPLQVALLLRLLLPTVLDCYTEVAFTLFALYVDAPGEGAFEKDQDQD